MIIANQYVIKELRMVIKGVLGGDDITKITELCKKFSNRYVNDKEFKNLCGKSIKAILSKDEENIKKIEEELKKLENIRRIETSGGTEIWFKGLRPGGIHYVVR